MAGMGGLALRIVILFIELKSKFLKEFDTIVSEGTKLAPETQKGIKALIRSSSEIKTGELKVADVTGKLEERKQRMAIKEKSAKEKSISGLAGLVRTKQKDDFLREDRAASTAMKATALMSKLSDAEANQNTDQIQEALDMIQKLKELSKEDKDDDNADEKEENEEM
jgi:hypothetical protein